MVIILYNFYLKEMKYSEIAITAYVHMYTYSHQLASFVFSRYFYDINHSIS